MTSPEQTQTNFLFRQAILSSGMMVLFLTQLFLIPVMFILSRYLKKHLSVSVEEKTVFAEKDRPFTWTLKAENRGRLPVTRFALRFQIFRKKKSGRKDRCVCVSAPV